MNNGLSVFQSTGFRQSKYKLHIEASRPAMNYQSVSPQNLSQDQSFINYQYPLQLGNQQLQQDPQPLPPPHGESTWLYQLVDGWMLTLPEILRSQKGIAQELTIAESSGLEDMPYVIAGMILANTWEDDQRLFRE